jgi:4,5:9,10-diseco-3-hydroxy-5,9,17-trioxoandrosta-1(10),2-diene-4-oate hydrolase
MDLQRPVDQYVQVRDIRTRFWSLGVGNSYAILLHGLGGHVENWAPNIAALAWGRQVFALDLVGFGRTDKPAGRHSIPFLVEFINDFMTVKGIPWAALIGESLGGAIALRFALDRPDQVEKLVLADSVGFGRDVSIYLRIPTLPLLGELLTRPSREASARNLRRSFHDPNLVSEESIDEDYQLSLLPGAHSSLLRTLRASANLWGFKNETFRPVLERAKEIRMPSLIIWGAQDRTLPLALGRRAAQVLPNAQLHIFDRCGHEPNMVLPDEFNQLVKAFLSDTNPTEPRRAKRRG